LALALAQVLEEDRNVLAHRCAHLFSPSRAILCLLNGMRERECFCKDFTCFTIHITFFVSSYHWWVHLNILSGSDLELYRVIVSCGELVGGEAEMIRRVLEDAVAEAVDHAPSLIILDDLDGLIPGGSEGPEPATTVVALSEFLGDLMDLYQV
jgi:hypothetical protein